MKYHKYTLKNGLRIILAPMQDTETATVLVMTGVGSRYETRKENGIAHFLEHMFFKGTERRPTTLDVSKELDSLGAEFNAFTGEEYTGYYAKVAADHWGVALDVIADMFLHSKLEPAEIERERGAILQEINMREDMMRLKVQENFQALLYGDTPLGRLIAGPKENIKAFQRKDFVRFMRRAYTTENVVIGIAGKVDAKLARTAIAKQFATVSPGKKLRMPGMKEAQTKPALHIQPKKTDQTYLSLGVRAYHLFHKDRAALVVLAALLGKGYSSRLFIEVRERRGLAYTVHTGVDCFKDAGYLATSAGVEHQNLEETVQVILDEYRKIATVKVDPEELLRTKESLKGSLALSLEGSEDVIEYLMTQEILQDAIVLPQEKMKAIDRVTAEDVLRVAKDIFQNRKLNLTVIGPKAKRERLQKLLKL